ncbi:MAG: hypothetical protein JXR67_02440 [Bacteroidales bacterium]|nr:hypothetical protein [Bacteroidales bacterium]
MRNYAWLLLIIFLFPSCTEEPEKNRLLEATINGQLYTFNGIARKYNDYTAGQKTGIEYRVFNNEFNSLSIEAYDDTFTKVTFTFPEFTATWKLDLGGGRSLTYNAVSGQFRILGTEHGNLRGDFSFKVKNIADPLDSLMITDGYFDIFLEESDRMF